MFVVRISILAVLFALTDGHGRLINPPGRSTMWRYGFNTPHNSNDHQLSCGGFGVQYYRYDGKCGICGDPYGGPRENEAGGIYATGTIAKTYKQGSSIKVEVEITVNHGGWFEFRICPNNDPKKPATEECLNKYLLPDVTGVTRHTFPAWRGVMPFTLQLPKDLTCTQCVFQWKYNTASNTQCDGSKCCRGCGPQEQFYGCADVAITADGDASNTNQVAPPNVYNPHILVPPTLRPSVLIQPAQNTIAPQTGWSFGGNQGGSQGGNQANTLPAGVLQIPVDIKIDEDCKARDFWRRMNVNADSWCRQRCGTGVCPLDYCEKSCAKK